ncbi:hypothetical protein GCM10025866_24220 [Naasia aerilata]|uniref:Uncharacterized protein n=1 Tax=Naasia aerilata TaxID=1162966 RepID=A0ABN6XNH8_9MICO|nr:hypothetical protein [Naasia aerilata]BDZ46513.1 hypothetical protein GCM10025866_24220 [Naasia aerilata]
MAAEDCAVDDDARAHTGSDGEDQEVVVLPADAVEALGDGEGVDVVLDEDREAQLAAERGPERRLAPAELARIDEPVAAAVDAARNADADAQQGGLLAAANEAVEERD